MQARLTALAKELDRRERVAKQSSEAAAYTRTQLTVHRNAIMAYALEQQRAAEKKQRARARSLLSTIPALYQAR